LVWIIFHDDGLGERFGILGFVDGNCFGDYNDDLGGRTWLLRGPPASCLSRAIEATAQRRRARFTLALGLVPGP
jgi:hypothetical protein